MEKDLECLRYRINGEEYKSIESLLKDYPLPHTLTVWKTWYDEKGYFICIECKIK